MKTVSTALNNHFAEGCTTLATCWKVTRTDSTVFGFTDHDSDLIVDGVTYKAATGYSRTATQAKPDLSVDNLELEAAFSDDAITLSDLRAGIWDSAEVLIFMVNWADLTQGSLILKRGTLGAVTYTENSYVAELRGMTQALSQKFLELYTPDCSADLGDSRCTKDISGLAESGTVTATGGNRYFTDSARTEADNYWKCGVVTWTSGANSGRKMEVSSFASGVFTLFLALPDNIEIGDTFTVTPGCDKTLATCRDVFNNVANFRGFPHLPGENKTFSFPDAS